MIFILFSLTHQWTRAPRGWNKWIHE